MVAPRFGNDASLAQPGAGKLPDLPPIKILTVHTYSEPQPYSFTIIVDGVEVENDQLTPGFPSVPLANLLGWN